MESKELNPSVCPPVLPLSSVCSVATLGGAICCPNPKFLDQQIKEAQSFEEFWVQNKGNIIDNPLPKYLLELLNAKGLSRADVIVKTGLDKAYAYQIFAGIRNPSRDKLITIALGIDLSEDETQELLRLAGHRELWVKDERDALILFAIRHKLSLVDVHTELERYGLDPLATPIK